MSRLFPGSAICVMALACATDALALSARVWVSGKGVDTASCGPVATPCRSMQVAHDNTTPGGEINVLDSAGYGAVTISKAINVVADGVLAGLLAATGGNAVTVNAAAGDQVSLRGLTVEGAGVGANGIVFNSGGNLSIVNCLVQNFVGADDNAGNGILLKHTTNDVTIRIANTTTSGNGFVGLYYHPKGTVHQSLVLENIVSTGNKFGVIISTAPFPAYADVWIANSTASSNSFSGFHMFTPNAKMYLTGNLAMHNANGFDVSGTANAVVFLSRNTGMGNGMDMQTTATATLQNPVVFTFGNNNFGSSSYAGAPNALPPE